MRRIVIFFALLGVFALALFEYKHQQGNQRAAKLLANFKVIPLGDIGSTRSLRILPLMEYHSANPKLQTEVGVSYLIETDNHRILYDVGHNMDGLDPSPLQMNMETLGVELDTIDMVFISHNHMDHVGGFHWQRMNTFSLGRGQPPFPNPKTILVAPDLMTYPGMRTVYANVPMQVGDGVGSTGLATTGTIGRQLVLGWIEEHSLVVNVEGLGGVIIVACGHQPIPNLIARYEQVFDAPLYGIIGGLHFPVPEGRVKVGPLDPQRQLAAGEGLFNPLTMEEIDRQIVLLKQRNLGIVGVSGHDSSDEVIEKFRREFGAAHRYVRVGEEILIRAGTVGL